VKETAAELRRIRTQEEAALTAGNLRFDLHSIIGGQLTSDPDPTLYLLYPETNWVEVTEEMPYISIGVTGYAKPILDALCHYEMTLEEALRVAVLAADATIQSVSDVGYPVDCVMYDAASRRTTETRFEAADVQAFTNYWAEAQQKVFAEGAKHADPLFSRLRDARLDERPPSVPAPQPARRSA
jgi:putative proteasome-type protease